jgi:hypothetical protein
MKTSKSWVKRIFPGLGRGCESAIPSFLLPFLLRSYLLRLIRRLRPALEKGKKAGWKVQDTKNSGLSVLSLVLVAAGH